MKLEKEFSTLEIDDDLTTGFEDVLLSLGNKRFTVDIVLNKRDIQRVVDHLTKLLGEKK